MDHNVIATHNKYGNNNNKQLIVLFNRPIPHITKKEVECSVDHEAGGQVDGKNHQHGVAKL